jgi:hypothetical protein
VAQLVHFNNFKYHPSNQYLRLLLGREKEGREGGRRGRERKIITRPIILKIHLCNQRTLTEFLLCARHQMGNRNSLGVNSALEEL